MDSIRIRRLALCCAAALGSLLAGCAATLPKVHAPDGMQAVRFDPKQAEPDAYLSLSGRKNAPTILLLHGSNGVWEYSENGEGVPTRTMVSHRARFEGLGWNVMIIDSLRPRGVKELSRRPAQGPRTVFPGDRAVDVWKAIEWLGKNARVDMDRIAIMGFSNGGATALNAVDSAKKHPKIAAAVSFYPRCGAYLGEPQWAVKAVGNWSPDTPLMILVGTTDSQAPVEPCRRLAGKFAQHSTPVKLLTFEGARHSFETLKPDDGDPVHHRQAKEANEAARDFLLKYVSGK